MKNRCLFILSAMLLVASVANAGEREDLKKYFDYYVGTWEITRSDSDQKGSLVITETESGNSHLVVYKFAEATSVAIWGYDPEAKEWVGNGFAKDGGYIKTVV